MQIVYIYPLFIIDTFIINNKESIYKDFKIKIHTQ
jgi:hypothetical protein